MFYPIESLRRGGRFYLCWVADSWPLRFATVTQRQLWSQDVRVICDDLLEVMNRESGYASTRFSLRLSSQLMRGLVRLYQRKVTVFLGDLCMMNATVTKHTNKKWSPQEREPQPKTSRRAVVLDEVPEEEARVEERIQNSCNVVANIELITMKEAAFPEIQVPTDGFGEENPEQAFQLFNDRTMEQMLGQADGSAAQHSALELLMLDSVEKSHDKSRLHTHDEMQMQRISEIDLSMLRKSTVDDLMQMDLEKDIPQIPEILITDISVPPLEKEVIPEPAKEKTPGPKEVEAAVELELEELEENAEAKSKRPKRLIIDKRIKTTGSAFRQRLDCIDIEQRCEKGCDMVDALSVPAEHYFARPASVGWRRRSHLAYPLSAMFLRRLGGGEHQQDDEEIEEMVGMKRGKTTRATREKEASKTPPIPVAQHPSIVVEETLADLTAQRVSAAPPPLDLSDMPTQIIMVSPGAQKRSKDVDDLGDAAVAKKPCFRSGYVTFRGSEQLSDQLMVENQEMLEKEKDVSMTVTPKRTRKPAGEKTSKDALQSTRKIRSKDTVLDPNLPQADIPEIVEPEIEQMNEQDRENRVSQLLEAAGLADATSEPVADYEPRRTLNRVGDESSDTPLGSLDRTRVEVGESVMTTDTQKFLRTEWGTQGTMVKIVKLLNKGRHPLSVRVLVDIGPVSDPSLEKIVAARCFTSLLSELHRVTELKQHGFIKLEKDASTLGVTNIIYGSKIKTC